MRTIGWPVIFVLSCFLLVEYGCDHAGHDAKSRQEQEGEKLAKLYCSSCHQYPSPELLTKQIWKSNVLPVMSNFMGLHYKGDSIELLPPAMAASDSATLPVKVSIPADDFRKIENFYLHRAPDSLPVINRQEVVSESSTLFDVQCPLSAKGLPFTTSITIDPAGHRIYQGDAVGKSVNVYDSKLQAVSSFSLKNIPTAISLKGRSIYVTNIGALKPGPGMQSGNLVLLPEEEGGEPKTILDNLNRSVESTEVDLDNDGRKDWLVCEFGFLRGSFSWYRNLGNGNYEKKLIKPVPGAIRAYPEDVNNDGKMDIWVLFGQAKEGISLFVNKGNGSFEEKEILKFPPVYGSSYFELTDMNNDGKKDIIYTCGDNADYSGILKPYHGIYIFINEGDFHFKQKYFFPMNGCYKAMAVDFDKDGDLDLACISYFADYDHHPGESFIYLENNSRKNGLSFVPHTIDKLPGGRWICMDAKDVDGDGWPDIVLGNMAAPYQNRRDWQAAWMQAPPFVVLKNKHL